MDDESKQMHVDSLNVQVFNHQPLKDSLPVIEHAGSSGKGFPYAPEDFPSPGDVWTWRVGKRHTHAGFWQDRSVHPPDRLQSSMGNKISFRGRASLEQYIRKTFPDADVDAFFASFAWKIPCTNVANDASLKAIKSKGCSKSAAIVQPGDCKASNEMCLIKAKTGSALTPATCNICCSEPNFCRNCSCILCSKTIDWIYDGYSWIKCEALVDEKFICGHVAHIECALRAYLAGKVGGSIDLDAQYYCRCCDNKTDLLLHVQKIIKVSESIDDRDDMVKVLNLGFCMLRGSEKERAEKLRNHIATSIEKLKHGVLSEDIWSKRSEISELEQESMEGMHGGYCSMKENVVRNPRRRDSGSGYRFDRHYYSGQYSSWDRGGREREHRSRPCFRSLSPPPRDSKRPSDRREILPSVDVSRAPASFLASTQQISPNHSSRSSDHRHKDGSEPSQHRPGKEPMSAPIVSTGQQLATHARMVELKRNFPELCFDEFMFAPTLKRIPPEVMDNIVACVAEAFGQCSEWEKVAKCVSEVSRRRQVEIDGLKQIEKDSKKIISTLDVDLETSRKLQVEAEGRAEEAMKALEDEHTKHHGELEVAYHRNHKLSERVKKLEAELEREKKAKEEVLEEAQGYCNEIVKARAERDETFKQRDAALEKVKGVDVLIKKEAEATEERITAELDKVIVQYNANVLKFRNLEWYKKDYPKTLALAWEEIVAEEKEIVGDVEVDLEQLEKEVLIEDEPEVLRRGRLILHPELAETIQKDRGETSGSSTQGAPSTETTMHVSVPNPSTIHLNSATFFPMSSSLH